MPDTKNDTFSPARIATEIGLEHKAPVAKAVLQHWIGRYAKLMSSLPYVRRFNDPLLAAIRSGLSRLQLTRRFGKNFAAPLAKDVGFSLAKKLVSKLGPAGFVADAAYENLPVLGRTMGLLRGDNSLEDVGNSFLQVGRGKMRGSGYENAVQGGSGASSRDLFDRYAVNAGTSPGSIVNSLAAGAVDTMQADFDLGSTMDYGLANAASTDAVRAGQKLRSLYRDPRAAGLTMKDVHDMAALRAQQGLSKETAGENIDVQSFIQDRLPVNIQRAILNRAKLRGKMQLMDPAVRPQVETATGYTTPLSPYQRALQDIRGTSPAEYPSYPTGQKGG